MIKKVCTTITIFALLLPMFWSPRARAETSPILITEVQVGFVDSAGVDWTKQEFIEVTNTSSSAIDLTGWRMEYLSSANNGSGAPTAVIDTMKGVLNANSSALWVHDGYVLPNADMIFGVGDTSGTGLLAKTAGHVRIMNGTSMVDCVAWGSAVAITGCDKIAALASPGYTLQRRATNGIYNKSDGVVNATPATPVGGGLYRQEATIELPTNPVTHPTCDNVQLSEILANPAGDDALGEFIELYNPNDTPQSLYGCSLKISGGKEYVFTDTEVLQAHAYKTFPYSLTKLQLGNSGGSVTLSSQTTITTTTYPAVGDDESWAFDGSNWSIAKPPTPNTNNLFLQATVEPADPPPLATVEPESCPEGKYRNPATGRCKNIPVAAVASVCLPDQERNPTTGRCRKIVIAKAATVCPPGQEKNPTTNRCRKITAASTAKDCPKGQERNKDTNRCRKVVAGTNNKSFNTKPPQKIYNYLIVGAILLAVAGYGIYEYRHDLANLWQRRRKGLPEEQ